MVTPRPSFMSFKVVAFFLLVSYQNQICSCGQENFQTNIEGFIDAFENAYATEDYYQTTDEVRAGNEVPGEVALEEASKQIEENVEAVQENTESGQVNPEFTEVNVESSEKEPVEDIVSVTETVFQSGSEVHHELTDDVRALAQRAVTAIGNKLRLVSVTQATSMITDKVQRSLSLVVAKGDCLDEDCVVSCRVELVSQDTGDKITWHNCLDSPTTNEIARKKRGAIGGFKQVDEAEAKELAEVAVQTLDSIDADDTKRIITHMIRAQKQLVNGIMYHLTLEVASSDCKEDADSCEGPLTDHHICKILMQRLFSGDAPRNAQVIKSECTPVSKAKESDKKRARRHAVVDWSENNMITNEASDKQKKHSRTNMMGGKVRQDPNSNQIKEIADFALASIDKASNSLNKQKIVRIVDARSQVVAGTKYFLKLELVETNCRKNTNQDVCNPVNEQALQSCNVVVWDKPWENFRTITRVECAPVHQRQKRDGFGSRKDADPNDPKVQEVAQFALSQLAGRLNRPNTDDLSIVVKKAQTQLVAGSNYYLTLQLVESPNKVIQECEVVVYDRPWDKHREMTSANCKDANRKKRDGFGSRKDADPNDPKVQEVAQFALSQLAGRLNRPNTDDLSIVVKKAQTQLVAGSNYYLTLQLVESPNKVIQECEVVVYDRPWDKHREMTSANCKDANRKKRAAPGSKKDADPNDPKVQEVSQFALSQLAGRLNRPNTDKLSVLVKKAETQTVAGSNYFLTLQLVETPNKVIQECEVVVYDRPWDKHREMTSANCKDANRKKRAAPGSKKDADPNDPKVQEVSQFALSQLAGRLNRPNTDKLSVLVKKAETQTVAGSNYFLTLQLVETPNKVIQECEVVVYDRPWDKHREMTSANCKDANRKKRAAPASKKDADPNDPKVQEVSQFAFSQLARPALMNGPNTDNLSVLVKKAETQTVAGTNYFLTLQLIKTPYKVIQVIQECEVVVYDRPWDKHREMTSANCKDANRKKREVLIGGRNNLDPKDSKVQEVARFALSELDAKSNSLNTQKIIDVTNAQSQLVSGLNYYLTLQLIETTCRKGLEATEDCEAAPNKLRQECDVVVYEKPWNKHREMTSSNCRVAPNSKKVHKRDVLVGGHTAQDKDSEEIQDAAQFAVEDINKKSNSMYKQTLVEVLSAHTQIVSGMNYHMKLRVAESECKKSNSLKSAICTTKDSAVHQICDVTVWSQPWLKKRQVTNSNCQLENQNKKVSGEPRRVDPSSPDVLDAAKLSLKRIDRSSNSLYKHALIQVLDAKVQTVSGKKYFLNIEIGESECTKSHSEENCVLRSENSLNEKCNVVVWDQPWLNKKEVLDVKCGLRRKRSIIVTRPTENGLDEVHQRMFEEFKSRYNKVYPSEEENSKRFRIFRANLKKIKAFQDSEQGSAIYGPNVFADLTAKEFKLKYLGLKLGPAPKPSPHHMVPATIPDVTLPTDFDWRDHNAVTPVKNQGMCGSCWAFSVTGNVEGQWFLKHGNLLSLSEQELVDCDKTDSGCQGGYMTQAYEAIERLGGLETEEDYPYDAEDETCKFNASEVKVQVASSVNITTNETQIAQWLFKNGPISIGINANAMQFYMGGVSHPLKFLCNKNSLDHGVLLVGFGVHRTSIRHKLLPYWLIKNSWGPHWGEKGYYRVYRGDGTCGVNQMASSAIVE